MTAKLSVHLGHDQDAREVRDPAPDPGRTTIVLPPPPAAPPRPGTGGRPRRRLWVLGLTIAAVAVGLLGLLGLLGLRLVAAVRTWDPLCENTVVERSPSLDGRRAAVVFTRSCGATTELSTQISIVDAGEAVHGPGNVFVCDGPATPGHQGPGAEVEWRATDELVVTYDGSTEVFTQERRHGGIQVTYVPVT